MKNKQIYIYIIFKIRIHEIYDSPTYQPLISAWRSPLPCMRLPQPLSATCTDLSARVHWRLDDADTNSNSSDYNSSRIDSAVRRHSQSAAAAARTELACRLNPSCHRRCFQHSLHRYCYLLGLCSFEGRYCLPHRCYNREAWWRAARRTRRDWRRSGHR